MGLLDLTSLEILQGSLSLMYVIIVFKLGIKIISQFFKQKPTNSRDWTYIYFGVFFILMSSLNWSISLSFISNILIDNTIEPILFFGITWIPMGLAQLCWMFVLHGFKILRREYLYWVFYLTTTIIYEVFLIIFLITDLSMIGILTGRIYYFVGPIFIPIFAFFSFSHYSFTLIILFRHLMKSKDIKIRWRARFYLGGYVLLMTGDFLSMGFMLFNINNLFSALLVYILLIPSAFSYYFAFYMPEWLSKWLLKDYNEISEDIKVEDDKVAEFMNKFVRPQIITEEEVSITKEKKICLVCKSKVGGLLFMCKNCTTFYCIKCSEALSNLENECWVCDAPFDKSKPVKPSKREEKEERVDIVRKGKKKS